MLEKIVRWGEREEAIRALVLQGSRGRDVGVDEFSDYDVAVICDDRRAFIESEGWLKEFGKVWVCVKECVAGCYPSRLVIFDGGIKVDFSFLGKEVKLYEGKVLLDKDGSVVLRENVINEEEFKRVVQEFWFEIWHVAVYLERKDFKKARMRRQAADEFLLTMIGWDEEKVLHVDEGLDKLVELGESVQARVAKRYGFKGHMGEEIGKWVRNL